METPTKKPPRTSWRIHGAVLAAILGLTQIIAIQLAGSSNEYLGLVEFVVLGCFAVYAVVSTLAVWLIERFWRGRGAWFHGILIAAPLPLLLLGAVRQAIGAVTFPHDSKVAKACFVLTSWSVLTQTAARRAW